MDAQGKCDRTCEIAKWVGGKFVRQPLRGQPCDTFCKVIHAIAETKQPWESLDEAIQRFVDERGHQPWEEPHSGNGNERSADD